MKSLKELRISKLARKTNAENFGSKAVENATPTELIKWKKKMPKNKTELNSVEKVIGKYIQDSLSPEDFEQFYGLSPMRMIISNELYQMATMECNEEMEAIQCPKCNKWYRPKCEYCETKHSIPLPNIQKMKIKLMAVSKWIDKFFPNKAAKKVDININMAIDIMSKTLVDIIRRRVPEDERDAAMIEFNNAINEGILNADAE